MPDIEMLHPASYDWIILGLFVPVAIIQWCLVIPLAKRNGVLTTLGDSPVAGVKSQVPFVRDGFFILWNLLPIVAAAIYGVIWYNWEDWALDLRTQFSGEVNDIYRLWIGRIRFDPAYTYAMVAAAAFACLCQIWKQRKFIARAKPEDDRAYWWDWRISKSIFLVRFAALFVNMWAALFFGTGMALLFGFVTQTVIQCTPNPMLLHPDGAAGFAGIGSLCFWLALAFFFITGTSLVGLFDHWRTGIVHLASDFASFAFCLIAGFWILLFPSLLIDRKFNEQHRATVEASKKLNDQAQQEFQRHVLNHDDAAAREWLERNAGKLLVLRELQAVRTSPVSKSDVLSLLSTFLLPLGTWMFFKLLDIVFSRTGEPARAR